MCGDRFKEPKIIFPSGPGREGDECGLQREARVAAEIERAKKIGAGVTFFKFEQNFVIERFDGAGEKEAAGTLKDGERVRVVEKMFDLDRDIIRKTRMFRV